MTEAGSQTRAGAAGLLEAKAWNRHNIPSTPFNWLKQTTKVGADSGVRETGSTQREKLFAWQKGCIYKGNKPSNKHSVIAVPLFQREPDSGSGAKIWEHGFQVNVKRKSSV